MNKCAKYVENNKCNLTDYLKYTGAVYNKNIIYYYV